MKDIVRAFPRNPGAFDGMDLRDYFAAKAMQSLGAIMRTTMHTSAKDDLTIVASVSYMVADAMIKERKKWV